MVAFGMGCHPFLDTMYTMPLWPDDPVAIHGFHVGRDILEPPQPAPWDSGQLLDLLEALAPDSDFTQGVNKPLV